MKASTINWHLARDNRLSLHKFCEKNRIKQGRYGDIYEVDGKKYFQLLFQFDNDGYIRAELRAGDEHRSYSVADHFQVVEYDEGRA